MKKFILVLVVLLAAVPAMAVVTIDANQVGDTNEVDITVEWSGEATIPRAFALDITVDSGQTITKVANYHTGESRGPGDRGFGIFPASFNREIDADDPNWADVNYTPVADVNDLIGDTQPGVPGTGVTIEMGSLYVAPNAPPSPSMLCSVWVSGDCNMCFALNVGRAGIVLEDGNAPGSDNMPFCVLVDVEMAVVCVVPDVVDMLEADAITAIEAEGFVAGTPTTEKHDSIVAGNVISTDPAALAEPGCGTTVEIVTSLGPCVVPDVVGDANLVAQAAIIAEGFTVGNITTACSVTVPTGDVISTTPAALAEPGCGTAVDIVVSTGPLAIVPDVAGMKAADAKAAIIAADLTLGSCSLAIWPIVVPGRIISTDPPAGATCDPTVDYVVSNLGDVAGGTSPDGKVDMSDKNLIGDWVNAYGVGRPLAIPSTDTAHYVPAGDVDNDNDLDMADKNLIGDWVNAYGAGRPLSIPCACP